MTSLPEQSEKLWRLTVPPLVWAAHFLACYLTAAIWCARVVGRMGPLGSVRIAIGAYTLVALVAIAVVGRDAYRRHTLGTATVPHDFDTPEDRHRFLGFATLLLAGVSAVGVVFAAVVALFFQTCH